MDHLPFHLIKLYLDVCKCKKIGKTDLKPYFKYFLSPNVVPNVFIYVVLCRIR